MLDVEETLVALGPACVPAVGRLLLFGSGEPPAAALRVLVRIGAPALPTLHEALSAVSAQRRLRAIEALAVIGRPASIEHLSCLLDDPHDGVRDATREALESYGETALPHLEAAARVCRPTGRGLAIRLLVKLNSTTAWNAIQGALSDADPGVRSAAATALALSGDETRCEASIAALVDINPAVRLDVAPSILQNAGPEALQWLESALMAHPPEVRQRAGPALAEHLDLDGVPGLLRRIVPEPALTRLLIQQLQSRGRSLRAAAHRAITELEELPVHDLADLLRHDIDDVRDRAIELLGLGGRRTATWLLQRNVRNADPECRRAVMEVLVKIGEPSVQPLAELARREWGSLQATAIQTLGRLGHRGAVRPLVRLLEEGQNSVAVAQALERIAWHGEAVLELREALPILKQRLAPWAFTAHDEAEAYRKALRAIEDTTRGHKDLPLPSEDGRERPTLPIPSAPADPGGEFPLPARPPEA